MIQLPRFLLWFNGNGIPERYWIPTETGPDYSLTPCLSPLAPVRNYVHVISGVDNVAARLAGQGNGHMNAIVWILDRATNQLRAYDARWANAPSTDRPVDVKFLANGKPVTIAL